MKKGFTLIELLAVILILGIIALIAIPQITDVIEESKISSGKVSVDNYIDAVEDLAVSSEIKGSKLEGMYSSDELKDYGLEIKGDIKNVRVVVDATGSVSSGQFCANDKSFTYDGTEVFYQENMDLCNEVLLTKIKEVFTQETGYSNVVFAIDENNTLYGWGKNTYNVLLQDEIDVEYKVPVKVGTNLKFKKIAYSSYGSVLGVTVDGKLYAWGYDNGLLGTASPTWDSIGMYEVLPGVIINDAIVDINFAAALDNNGNIYAWGTSGYYAFNTSISYTPTIMHNNSNYKSIYPAYNGMVALDKNGDIWTWGSSYLTANGTDGGSSYNAPAKRTNGLHIKKIVVTTNPSFAYALGENGKVYSWGSNNVRGLTGLYENISPINTVSLIKEDSNIIDIATSHDNVFLLYNDGTILEAHTYKDISNTINIGKKFTNVYKTSNYNYAIDEYGNLYAWGTANLLGLGDSLTYLEPIKISKQYKKASSNLFLDTNNKLHSYADIDYGRELKNYYLPDSKLVDTVDVKDFDEDASNAIYYVDFNNDLKYVNRQSSFTSYYNGTILRYNLVLTDGVLTANVVDYNILGNYSGISLDANNDLRAWGFNYYGRYGDTNTETTWYSLRQIATDHKVSKFASSEYNTYIIDTNGNLFGTGDNTYGQLGNGTTTKSSAFIPIMSGTKFKDVKTDGRSFIAVTTDNKIYLCGENTDIISKTSTPVQILFPGSFASIEYYGRRLVIKDTNDVLWGLGSNYYGNLGLGDAYKITEFTKLFNGKKVREVKFGLDNIYMLDQNNDLYVVGDYLSVFTSLDNKVKYTPYKLLSNIETMITVPKSQGSNSFFIFKDLSGDYYGFGYNNYNVLLNQVITIDKPTKVNFYK